jgi:hypothetical protein
MKKPVIYLGVIVTIINFLTVIGLWRIFYLAITKGSITVVPDSAMPLEVTVVFPLVALTNVFVFIVLMIEKPRVEKK